MQSIIPKIFDKLCSEKLYSHVESIISKNRHGFQKHRGTNTNLLEITQYLKEEIDKGNRIDVIYFDLAKAFDRADHRILAKKLANCALPFFFYKTIMSFISGRSYILKSEGVIYKRTKFYTSSSVPQGSHIGPLLFILMCNDMSTTVDECQFYISQLADDTKIYGIVNNEVQATNLQMVISRFKEWTHNNKLELNAKKTIHVSYKNKRNQNNFSKTYYIGSDPIIQKDKTRDLGVIFDSHLTFDAHLDEISGRALRAYGAGYRFAIETKHHGLIMHINQV